MTLERTAGAVVQRRLQPDERVEIEVDGIVGGSTWGWWSLLAAQPHHLALTNRRLLVVVEARFTRKDSYFDRESPRADVRANWEDFWWSMQWTPLSGRWRRLRLTARDWTLRLSVDRASRKAAQALIDALPGDLAL